MTMASETTSAVVSVRGPDGRQLRMEDLPPANTKRWFIRMKGEVVCAVKGKLISFETACQRWGISPEELRGWIADYSPERNLKNLRTTVKRRRHM